MKEQQTEGKCVRPAVCIKILWCESFFRSATRWPFNKYGMVNGHVETISPDAAELPDTRERDRKDTREHVMPPSGFRTLVALDSPYLERDGKQFRVSAGMLVSSEVNLGSRTVMEYLLSPVQKVTHEAGREM